MSIAKPAGNLNCATHFDLSSCHSLFPGHLEQIAIACPNLQRLNLRDCSRCLESVKGLKTIASHRRNLTGLNLLHIPNVEDHILLWEILSDMKLTHLAIDYCNLTLKCLNKEKLIAFLRKCSTIKGIHCDHTVNGKAMLSYFKSLEYCYLESNEFLPLVGYTIGKYNT